MHIRRAPGSLVPSTTTPCTQSHVYPLHTCPAQFVPVVSELVEAAGWLGDRSEEGLAHCSFEEAPHAAPSENAMEVDAMQP